MPFPILRESKINNPLKFSDGDVVVACCGAQWERQRGSRCYSRSGPLKPLMGENNLDTHVPDETRTLWNVYGVDTFFFGLDGIFARPEAAIDKVTSQQALNRLISNIKYGLICKRNFRK